MLCVVFLCNLGNISQSGSMLYTPQVVWQGNHYSEAYNSVSIGVVF